MSLWPYPVLHNLLLRAELFSSGSGNFISPGEVPSAVLGMSNLAALFSPASPLQYSWAKGHRIASGWKDTMGESF